MCGNTPGGYIERYISKAGLKILATWLGGSAPSGPSATTVTASTVQPAPPARRIIACHLADGFRGKGRVLDEGYVMSVYVPLGFQKCQPNLFNYYCKLVISNV